MEKNDEEIHLIFGAKRERMVPQVKPYRKIGSDGKDGQTDIM
jgi:hypothetical protein